MRAVFLLFTLLALILLTLFFLSRPPLEIINSAQSLQTGPTSSGVAGSSLVYQELENAGYKVSLEGSPGRVTVLLGYVDEDSVARAIAPQEARIARQQGYAVLLVTTRDPSDLLSKMRGPLRSMGFHPKWPGTYVAGSLLPRPRFAVSPGGNIWPVKSIYTSIGGTVPLAVVGGNASQAAAVAVIYTDGRAWLYVVLVSDPEAFTNLVVAPLLEKGLSPGPFLADILSAVGAPPGSNVSAPPYAFRELNETAGNPASLRLEIREAAASILSSIAGAVRGMFSSLASRPEMMLGLGLAGLLLGYLAGRGIAGPALSGAELSPVRPLDPVHAIGLSREFVLASRAGGRLERLSKPEAKRVIGALYELADAALQRLYGVSLEEAASKGALAPKEGSPLTGDPGLDRLLERLYVIYQRKVLSSRFLPLVNIRKEAARLYRELLPFLERAQIKLEGERGVEYYGV